MRRQQQAPLARQTSASFIASRARPRLTVATANVFYHRFYLNNSYEQYDRFVIANTCLFLAGKVEETPKKLKDVVIESYKAQHQKQDEPHVGRTQRKLEEFWEIKEHVLVSERILLQSHSASTSPSSTRTGVRATIAQRRASPASLPPSSSSLLVVPPPPLRPPASLLSPRRRARTPVARVLRLARSAARSLPAPPFPSSSSSPSSRRPRRPLLAVRQSIQGTRELAQVAWNFTNDSLKSAVVVLGFAPRAIAAAAVSLAAQYIQQGESALLALRT